MSTVIITLEVNDDESTSQEIWETFDEWVGTTAPESVTDMHIDVQP